MFFLLDFDFDDFAEGGVGFGLKFFITLGLIAIPIIFVRDFDNNVVYGTIGFSVALATLIINVLLFITRGISIKKEKSDIKNKKKRNYLISLAILVALSIVGYFLPITIFKMTFKGFTGLCILPIISSFISTIITSNAFINKKYKVINYIMSIIGMFITIVFLSAVLFFVMTFYHRFGIQDGDYKDTKFGNSAKQVFGYIENNVKYYDSSYDKKRNGKDIKDILQNKINSILELSSNEDEIARLSKLSNESENTLRGNKLIFLSSYVNSKSSMQSFKEEYGLNIQFRAPFDRCENYKQNRILTTYDKSTETTHYYIFNTDTYTINEEIPKNEYQDYVNKIINEAKKNHEYN